MLVLSRQRNESIVIGDNIIITVVAIRGDNVRLGIDAPEEVLVHRREVYEVIKHEEKRIAEARSNKEKPKEGQEEIHS